MVAVYLTGQPAAYVGPQGVALAMIALPFHPSNVYESDTLNENLADILRQTEIESARMTQQTLIYGPNIKDWLASGTLTENTLFRGCSKILDKVTTTDESLPSGETSSYRSNPVGLAEFTLSHRVRAMSAEVKPSPRWKNGDRTARPPNWPRCSRVFSGLLVRKMYAPRIPG